MKKHATKKRSRTNWAKIDALKDGEIDTSDIPEQGKAFFKRAMLTSRAEGRCDHSIGPSGLKLVQDQGAWLSDTDQCSPSSLHGSAQRMRRGQPTVLLARRTEKGWSLMIFCARATRGLRRPSLDARNGRSIAPSLGENKQVWREHVYRPMCAVKDSSVTLAEWE